VVDAKFASLVRTLPVGFLSFVSSRAACLLLFQLQFQLVLVLVERWCRQWWWRCGRAVACAAVILASAGTSAGISTEDENGAALGLLFYPAKFPWVSFPRG
jgi:hypothetical protein